MENIFQNKYIVFTHIKNISNSEMTEQHGLGFLPLAGSGIDPQLFKDD